MTKITELNIRKAVLEINGYVVKEAPTGGWRVFWFDNDDPISIHDDKTAAVAATKRYVAGDKRRWRAYTKEGGSK
jgi:hypothetical protein